VSGLLLVLLLVLVVLSVAVFVGSFIALDRSARFKVLLPLLLGSAGLLALLAAAFVFLLGGFR